MFCSIIASNRDVTRLPEKVCATTFAWRSAAICSIVGARQNRSHVECSVADVEEIFPEVVGFGGHARNRRLSQSEFAGAPDESPHIRDEWAAHDLWEQVQSLVPDPTELRVLALMTMGERDVEPYAALLQIQTQPIGEQRIVVNRLKEKLKTRLQRKLDVKRLGFEWD